MQRFIKTFARSFHTTKSLNGWQQNKAVGYGIPLLRSEKIDIILKKEKYDGYKIVDITAMCTDYDCDKILTSFKPIVINKIIKDGIMMFTSTVQIATTGALLNNDISGPYIDDPHNINRLTDYSYWINNKYYYDSLYRFLKEQNIDPEQDAVEFYKLNESKLTYDDSISRWFHSVDNIKNKKLKDLFGVYLVGIC